MLIQSEDDRSGGVQVRNLKINYASNINRLYQLIVLGITVKTKPCKHLLIVGLLGAGVNT